MPLLTQFIGMGVAFDQYSPFETGVVTDTVDHETGVISRVTRNDDTLVDLTVVLLEDAPHDRGQDDSDHEDDDAVVPLHQEWRLTVRVVVVVCRVTLPCQVSVEELNDGDDEHANTESDQQPAENGQADHEALVRELHVVLNERVLGHNFQSVESRDLRSIGLKPYIYYSKYMHNCQYAYAFMTKVIYFIKLASLFVRI